MNFACDSFGITGSKVEQESHESCVVCRVLVSSFLTGLRWIATVTICFVCESLDKRRRLHATVSISSGAGRREL